MQIELFRRATPQQRFHGIARATADADVVAALRPIHAAALAKRLADEYVAATEFDKSALSRHRLDSLVPTPDARQFSVATAEDVILHKLTWFRDGGQVSDRQWNDVVGVLRVQRDLDLVFLRDWAARLGVTDLLERALLEADQWTAALSL